MAHRAELEDAHHDSGLSFVDASLDVVSLTDRRHRALQRCRSRRRADRRWRARPGFAATVAFQPDGWGLDPGSSDGGIEMDASLIARSLARIFSTVVCISKQSSC